MRVVLTGGGSGGHVYPLIAIARELRRREPDVDIRFIGPATFGVSELAAEGITVRPIAAGKFPRYLTPTIIKEVFKIPLGFVQALWELYWHIPDVVFGKGGYGMVPVVLGAWFFRIPVIIHESDAVAGLASRLCARLAREVLTSFPETKKLPRGKPRRVVGNPVRAGILAGDRVRAQNRFRVSLKPVVLVLGGSQGAERLNTAMATIAAELTREAEVIHQAGRALAEQCAREIALVLEPYPDRKHFYHVVPFFDEAALADAYTIATIAVSRAGSGAIFEFALAGIPALLIPLAEAAGNHQYENARALVRLGAARMLASKGGTIEPHLLLQEIREMLREESIRKNLRERIRAFAKPHAASHIAEVIIAHAQE